jgi:hypothetical protein
MWRNQIAAVRIGLAAVSSILPSLAQRTSGHTGTEAMKTERTHTKQTGGEAKGGAGSGAREDSGSEKACEEAVGAVFCSKPNAPDESSK